MKAKLLALASLASLFVLNGCNCIGDKDTILARIDKENVYQEDYQLLLKNGEEVGKDKGKFLYDNLYSRAALTSRALSEYPELKQEWEDAYKDLEPRILTMVYQRFYVMECLMYSDEDLRRYYDANKSLFAEDSVSDYYALRKKIAESYYIFKNQEQWNAYLKEHAAPTDTMALRGRFVETYRQQLRDSVSKQVEEHRLVVVNEIPKVDARAYYERHKDSYMTVPGYVVYHIQGSNPDSLAKLFEENVSLDQFKQLAVASSQNAKTAADSGYVGFVKQDFALPYGIGIVPELAATLEGKKPGFVTPALKASQGNVYHRFYLVSQEPSKLKPFERVQTSIENGLNAGELFDVDSSFVLISKNGNPLFTEKDLLRYNQEYGRMRLNKAMHDRLTSMWAGIFTYAELAVQARLNHSWEFRAIARDTRWDYILKQYSSKKNDSIPENLYKYEYYMGYRLQSFGKNLEDCIPEIQSRISMNFKKKQNARRAAEAYSSATVHLYNPEVVEYKPEMLADVLLKEADSLYKADNRTAALEKYRDLQVAYADVDSLLEKATYEMALIQSENNESKQAEAGYYAYYSIWPEKPNAEKAMFSRGFILNEELGMNTRAQVVLEEFLKKYPNSELKESAQWLVDNIKSNGKLADELMKKIEAEE
ncbi:MAG: peptidyl-prolyl cis-trans isomerase [Fibrobacter sp.]|nr:peptidyl-prolyl cis-trans isomerase [Fibrobacter sp.]